MDAKKLDVYINSDNIADLLDEDVLAQIGTKVKTGYDIDLESRSDTDKVNLEAMKLAKQTFESKDTPWPGAANVKYPLITVAAIQFASRALPELVPDETIVNAKIVGKDENKEKEKRSERVTKYMDWQLTEDMPGWMDGMDRLLHAIPIVGTCFKKVYFDGISKKVCSKFCTYEDVVVNAKAECMATARRASHRIHKYKNYALEMIAAKLWLDKDIGSSGEADLEAPHLFLEQHRWLDLDEDGYEEPYVVTVHHNTGNVMRIVARYDAESLILKAGALVRIEPTQYFVKYPFIPNPDGGFYDIGFGSLLFPINESLNTAINQLLDAGAMSNGGGGFLARGVTLRGGPLKFKPNEWKTVDVMGGDLRAGVMPLPIREPSQVLFALLGMLISAGKDISSVQEAMSGQKPGENIAEGTVVALIEQGLKVFSGIYKRMFRAMTEEFKLIRKLNARYLDEEEYSRVLDEKVFRKDFESEDYDIIPSADPAFALESQRINTAGALLKISGRQGLDEDLITATYLKAVKAPATALIPPDKRPKPPVPIEIEQLNLDWSKFNFEREDKRYSRMKTFAQIEDLRAAALKKIADAEAAELGPQLDEYKAFLDDLGKEMEGLKAENDKPVEAKGPQADETSGI